MEIVLGVVNWPSQGLVMGDLYPLGTPQPFQGQGGRASRRYIVGREISSWSLLGPFMSYLCAEAGYRGFEQYETTEPAPSHMAQVFKDIGLRWFV